VPAAQQALQKAMTLATRTRSAQAARAAATQLTASQCLAATHRRPMLLRRRPLTALMPTWLDLRLLLARQRLSLQRHCHRCSLLHR
jgi:hypothetical protein